MVYLLVVVDYNDYNHPRNSCYLQWLIERPEFLSNPLYVCGDSYSGIIVPMIVQNIVNGRHMFLRFFIVPPLVIFLCYVTDIEARKKPLLNFKGYLLGNPTVDSHFELNIRVKFAHRMGLISEELYE
ncbi:hypothetical protein GIB67_034280, partial [Kingdonia uniflora]